jgi:NAD(P)-dependent dehydrogenase (short-subunit alcohol dehydrogenase family)
MGYPQDFADAVLYLISDMASYVTGQSIVVDGAQVDNSYKLDLDTTFR